MDFRQQERAVGLLRLLVGSGVLTTAPIDNRNAAFGSTGVGLFPVALVPASTLEDAKAFLNEIGA